VPARRFRSTSTSSRSRAATPSRRTSCVGFEGLIAPARANGAVGAVSALASAFPEIVAAAVRGEDVDPGALRAQVDRYPRHAALKHVLVRRGVPIREDVRAPLRGLTAAERTELDAELDQVFQAA
jgi:dihydrodipicolinate synthase/N-acetylneuraminate lyase